MLPSDNSPGTFTGVFTSGIARRLVLSGAGAVIMALLCLGALFSCGASSSALGGHCFTTPSPWPDRSTALPGGIDQWDRDQITNAALIVDVGRTMKVPVWGQTIAVAVAMQESSLRNLPHLGPGNDHDSIGLFQQRPSQGWGTPEQLADPRHAATAFYNALLAVPDWPNLPLTVAAQHVQRSAYPNAYAKWTEPATALVAVLSALTGNGSDNNDIAAALGCGPATPGSWIKPVAAPIGSGFRSSDRPGHHGVDLTAARHTIIRAASAGVVQNAACNAEYADGRPYGCGRDGNPTTVRGCGWYLDIAHPGGVITRYCHLQNAPWVTAGQTVAAGQPIGTVGSTGHSSGPHLHFEVHLHGDGSSTGATNPVSFMDSMGAPLGA